MSDWCEPLLGKKKDFKQRYLMLSEGWDAYRVKNAQAEVYVGLFHYAFRRRLFAVALSAFYGCRHYFRTEDSAPLIGEKPLFDVHPEDWIGQTLEIGGLTLREVTEVAEEEDQGQLMELRRRALSYTWDSPEAPVDFITPEAAGHPPIQVEWKSFSDNYAQQSLLALRLLADLFNAKQLFEGLDEIPVDCAHFCRGE